jgi:hypothetical protein
MELSSLNIHKYGLCEREDVGLPVGDLDGEELGLFEFGFCVGFCVGFGVEFGFGVGFGVDALARSTVTDFSVQNISFMDTPSPSQFSCCITFTFPAGIGSSSSTTAKAMFGHIKLMIAPSSLFTNCWAGLPNTTF